MLDMNLSCYELVEAFSYFSPFFSLMPNSESVLLCGGHAHKCPLEWLLIFAFQKAVVFNFYSLVWSKKKKKKTDNVVESETKQNKKVAEAKGNLKGIKFKHMSNA